MSQTEWTEAEMADGYEAMAELNRQLVADFVALEEEAAAYFKEAFEA